MEVKPRIFVLYLLLFFCVGLMSSCRKNVTLDINKSLPFPVPQDTPIDTPFTQSYPLPTSVLELSSKNIKPSEVKELRLKSLALTVMSPSGKNFDFLKSIRVYAYADDMPETLAGYLDEVPLNATYLTLNMTDASLAEIAHRDNFYLKAVSTFDQPITEEIYIRADMSFHVKARIKFFIKP